MPEKRSRTNRPDCIRVGTGNVKLLPTGETFSGTFNTLYIYQSEEAGLFVLRVPKPPHQRRPHVASLQAEYDNFGAQDISFRLRTVPQQTDFMDALLEADRKAIQYVGTTRKGILFPFIENGTPLNIYLQDPTCDLGVIQAIEDHLIESHKQGIIFGDRWGANTMVLSENDFIELDFDFELQGRPQVVAAFELAQFMYHVVHFTHHNRTGAVEKLLDVFGADPATRDTYDMEKLCTFLISKAAFFYDKFNNEGILYEGIRPPYEEIIDLVQGLSSTNLYTFRA